MTNLCLFSLLLKEKLVHLGEEKEQWAWDKMCPKSYPHSKFPYSNIDHVRFLLDQPKIHLDVHIRLNTRDALPAIPSKKPKFPWLRKGCSRAAPSLGGSDTNYRILLRVCGFTGLYRTGSISLVSPTVYIASSVSEWSKIHRRWKETAK